MSLMVHFYSETELAPTLSILIYSHDHTSCLIFHASQSHSQAISLSLTYGDVVVIGPGVYPVDGGAHAPALAALLLVPQQQAHPVPRVVVADVAGQERGVPVLVGDLLDPLHPREVRPQGPRQQPSQHPRPDHHESRAAGHFLEQKRLMKYDKIHFRDYKKVHF